MTATSGTLKRICIIFIAWSIIYLLPYNLTTIHKHGFLGPIDAAYSNINLLATHPVTLLFQGTKVHLWFLVSLSNALIITSLFAAKGWEKGLIVAASLLYIVGLLAKAYANTPIGLHLDFNTRNGPFFSTILFVTGYEFSKYKPKENWLTYGTLLVFMGFMLHFSEIYFLRKYFGTFLYQDFVVGTYFIGAGVSMIALSNHPILNIGILGQIGRYSLGIYAVHFIFVDLLHPIDRFIPGPVWELSYVILVMFLSICVVYLASKNKVTRMIVL